MSSKQIDPNAALQALREDGFHVETRDQHIFLHDIPFVRSDRSVGRGSLICTYFGTETEAQPPDNHQVWWTAEYPCFSNGCPIEQIRNEDGERELLPGVTIKHRFSNKPEHFNLGFPDHYSKLTHYAALIEAQASAISAGVTSKKNVNFRTPVERPATSPFVYADTASARASVLATSSKLAGLSIGIVGVGGTGAYVLDQVAKTPVETIHLYDGDTFEQHNAFRAPGAAGWDDISKHGKKVDYFAGIYSKMHRGVMSHGFRIEADTLSSLDCCDFVFLCVDDGRTRALVAQHLILRRTPFIDVGMNLHQVSSTNKLVGTCRTTLCSSGSFENFMRFAPTGDDTEDLLYRQNIQIADMNALNAQFAVMMWKQFCGFYQDDFGVSNLTFSVNTMSLVRGLKAADE
jgi:hypothetical protein